MRATALSLALAAAPTPASSAADLSGGPQPVLEVPALPPARVETFRAVAEAPLPAMLPGREVRAAPVAPEAAAAAADVRALPAAASPAQAYEAGWALDRAMLQWTGLEGRPGLAAKPLVRAQWTRPPSRETLSPAPAAKATVKSGTAQVPASSGGFSDASTGAERLLRLRLSKGSISGVAFQPSGERFAWTDGTTGYIAETTGKLMAQFNAAAGYSILQAGISRRGDMVLSVVHSPASGRHLAGWIDHASGHGDQLELPAGFLRAVDAPDGKSLVFLDRTGRLLQWDVAAGTQRYFPLGAPAGADLPMKFAQSGRLAVGLPDGDVLLLRLDEPFEKLRLKGDAGQRVTALAIDETGRKVIAANAAGRVRTWDLDLEEETVVGGEPGSILAIDWVEPGESAVWVNPLQYRWARFGRHEAEVAEAPHGGAAFAAGLAGRTGLGLTAHPAPSGGAVLELRALGVPARAQEPPAAPLVPAALGPSEPPAAALRARAKDLFGAPNDEEVVPLLKSMARDRLEIFRQAGRRWLAALAKAGDPDAAAALAGLEAEARAAAKAVVR